uniref:Uncharacterized protein n=1 Tax=Tetranychus urticae TaxID=32264 RepID=T1KTW3_TETUR
MSLEEAKEEMKKNVQDDKDDNDNDWDKGASCYRP